jgi:hypothetical protein
MSSNSVVISDRDGDTVRVELHSDGRAYLFTAGDGVYLDLAGGRAIVRALARILGPEVLEPEPEPGEQYFRAKAKALGVPGSGRADWANLIDQAKAEHAMVEAALIAQGWAP